MTLTHQAKLEQANNQDSPKAKQMMKKKDRNPSTLPSFTVGDIRRAIPPHCFERSLIKSFGYLFIDCLGVYLVYLASTYIPLITNEAWGDRMAPLLRHVCWTLYWIVQGNIMVGLWVIGHECGHGGFADSSLVSDTVGFIVHSALLVPFFSWKVSHRRHHSNTGNIDRDEVFVPEISRMNDPSHDDDGPVQTIIDTLHRMVKVFNYLVLGWPLYLMMNASGHANYPKGKWVNHFFPSSPIFTTSKEQILVLVSDLGLLVVVSIITYASYLYTFAHVAYVYLIPYLIVNLYLVLVTLLQHTDLALPHYDASEWDWLRGALATVDRDFGILNIFHHHIADTHIVHHLFSNLPHYHAQEATEAVKPLLGAYYRMDRTPIIKALWAVTRTCLSVKPDNSQNGVYWYDEPQQESNKKQN